MTVNTNPVPAYSMSDPFPEIDNLIKAASTNDGAFNAQNLLDKVDLQSFPLNVGDIASGNYGKTYTYHEDLSAFMADTKIEIEGKDGSKIFIHFSYKTISRKVHYEVIQSFGWTGDTPEIHKHPLDDYFGPKATADRILSFARGLVNKYRAMEGDDKEKLGAFIHKLIKAIDKGFRQAHVALGIIPQNIAGMIHETYDRVMKGMALLGMENSGQQEAYQTKLTYQEEISYTSASLEISIMV